MKYSYHGFGIVTSLNICLIQGSPTFLKLIGIFWYRLIGRATSLVHILPK